jgi:hypothetical protein
MRKTANTLCGALALAAASIDVASAADGCGRGLFWNGYQCVAQGYRGPPPVYREQFIPAPRYDGGRRGGYDPRCPNGGVYMTRPRTGTGCY